MAVNLEAIVWVCHQTLQSLINRGFQFPVTFVWISSEGALSAFRVTAAAVGNDPSGGLTPIAHYAPPGSEVWKPPLNILYVDARGEAARAVIDEAGESKLLN